MPHLESFFGKQETRKAQEEGEAEEAEQETSEQRRENKMQREKHARERKRRTHGQEIEGAAKEKQTQRGRGSANHPEKSVPQFGSILREEISRTLENKSRMLSILEQTFQSVLKLKVENLHN